MTHLHIFQLSESDYHRHIKVCMSVCLTMSLFMSVYLSTKLNLSFTLDLLLWTPDVVPRAWCFTNNVSVGFEDKGMNEFFISFYYLLHYYVIHISYFAYFIYFTLIISYFIYKSYGHSFDYDLCFFKN